MPIFSSMGGGSRRGFQAAPVAAELYPFTSHVFTNCGATGRNGPTLAQMQAAYTGIAWAQNSSFLNLGDYQGYQIWTVPVSGNYTFDVIGAAGGDTTEYESSYPGKGSRVQTTIALLRGEMLAIIVGQKGSYAGRVGGGGGGSFVVRLSDNSPLVIAGAGAGAYTEAENSTYSDASTTTTAKSRYPYSTPNTGGAGGFLSNGENASYTLGGKGFNNGLVGSDRYNDLGAVGGFGGGAAGQYTGGASSGSGGGYSGGGYYSTFGINGEGGCKTGGFGSGGSSYASGSNITITGAYGNGNGSVTITKV